jgi:hypothetical protein
MSLRNTNPKAWVHQFDTQKISGWFPDSSRRERYLEDFWTDPHVPKLTARALELPEDVVTSATLAGCPCARARSVKSADWYAENQRLVSGQLAARAISRGLLDGSTRTKAHSPCA